MDAGGPPTDQPFGDASSHSIATSSSREELRCEKAAALVLWAYLFALITGLVVARAASAALFLNCHGPRELGAVYILVALTVAGTVYALARLAKRRGHARVALLTISVAGVGAVLARLLAPAVDPDQIDSFYLGLYVAVESFAFLAPLQFWTLTNSLFDWSGARRRYAFIATGGILGSMAGGAAVRVLNLHNPLDLLWLLAALSVPVGASILLLDRWRTGRLPGGDRLEVVLGRFGLAPSKEPLCSEAPVHSGRIATAQERWNGISTKLGILALLTVAATTLVDFYFKLFADLRYDGHAGRLTQFFGDYYLAVGATTLALQLLVTPAVLRRDGPFGGLLLMPLAVGVAAILNLLAPTLLAAVVLKLVDSSFSHSVQRSCREILYTALPSDQVGGVQAVADGIWGRMGLFGCGVVLMFVGPYVGLTTWLGVISATVFLWIVALGVVHRAYQTQVPLRRPALPAPRWLANRKTHSQA